MKFDPPHTYTDEELAKEIQACGAWLAVHGHKMVGGENTAACALVALRLKDLVESYGGRSLQELVDKTVDDQGRTGVRAIELGWPFWVEAGHL